ncbi:hypothetical protein [Kocuria arenosa]|uniref:hypothetical protein n=1 Tax=Kocuria arenosa TaxID=3071446 RepID=UPI0034D40D9C
MDLQLSVITDIDPDTHRVRLAVTGALTEANHQLLLRVIQQAQISSSAAAVRVDLTGLQQLEAAAVELMVWELDRASTGVVEFIVAGVPAGSSAVAVDPSGRPVGAGHSGTPPSLPVVEQPHTVGRRAGGDLTAAGGPGDDC